LAHARTHPPTPAGGQRNASNGKLSQLNCEN
jgi:hypothetical protein